MPPPDPHAAAGGAQRGARWPAARRDAGLTLGADFFARPTLEVARDLIGKVLVRQAGGRVLTGRLIEVEAYCGPEDLAAHSSRGLTPRTRVMYGPPGHAYVYLIYGMYHCLNFVTRPEGEPQAVLVRGLEPGPGVGRCTGPGLLCRALDIDRSLNGAPLAPPHLYVVDDGYRPADVFTSPRIGVGYADEWAALPWRFTATRPRARPASKPPAAPAPPSPRAAG